MCSSRLGRPVTCRIVLRRRIFVYTSNEPKTQGSIVSPSFSRRGVARYFRRAASKFRGRIWRQHFCVPTYPRNHNSRVLKYLPPEDFFLADFLIGCVNISQVTLIVAAWGESRPMNSPSQLRPCKRESLCRHSTYMKAEPMCRLVVIDIHLEL